MRHLLILVAGFGWFEGAQAATSLNTQEANPATSVVASVPVGVQSDSAVRAFQTDVLFNPDVYEVTSAVGQAEGMLLDSRLIASGQLRVVVYPQFSGNVENGTAFNVPLTAKAGTVADFPVVLANFLVVGEDGAPLATGIAPQVKLLGLKDGKDLAGRQGIELSVDAQAVAGTITQVQYFIGGVLIGVGTGPNFRLLWIPTANGPYEITAVAMDSNGNVADSRTIPVVVSHIGTYTGTVQGTYVGLVRGDTPTLSTSGYVSMTSTSTGAFTVSLRMGAHTYSGSGSFDSNGLATVQFARIAPLPKLTLQLTQSTAAAVDQIHGRLTDGTVNGPSITGSTFITEFSVDRVVWTASRKPTSFAGNYTLLMPPSASAELEKAPLGTGFARMSIHDATGAMTLTGQLGDGSTFTHSTYVSKDGRVPVYASVHTRDYAGMISSWLWLRDSPGVSDGDGIMDWQRGAYAGSQQFPNGFMTHGPLLASRYTAPPANARSLTVANVGGNSELTLEDGGLLSPLSRVATMRSDHAVAVPLQGPENLWVAMQPDLGTFNGGFVHPRDGQQKVFRGAMLQKQNLASGYFRSGLFNGSVYLEPNALWELVPEDALPLGDRRLPSLSVTAPSAESTLPAATEEIVTSGTATHVSAIKEVWCHYLHDGVLSAPVLAEGTAAWTYRIPVEIGEGGRYTIFAFAVSNSGEQSEVLTHSCLVSLMKPLVVGVSGPGSVSAGFLGTTNRQVGKLVTITANPAAGKKFTGWTGSFESTAATLTFLMTPDLAVTANFSDP